MHIVSRLLAKIRPTVDRFPRVASLYRAVRDQLAHQQEPVLTPWGFWLAGNPAMADGTFEPAETELVRNLLREADILVNVGANIGYYCCHALSMGKRVIAFEPMPRNMSYLCKNIKANDWSGVEIYPIALSDTAGILEIYGGNTGASLVKGWAGSTDSQVTLVPTSTMDIVIGSRLHGEKVLVVVDIEGAEKWMLEGATELLSNNPMPIWLVEITSTENQPAGTAVNPYFKSTFSKFFDNGYEAFSIGEKVVPVTEGEVDLVLDGVGEFPSYNFLFRKSTSN